MESLQLISFALDIVLVVVAVVAFWARPRIGGELAKGLRLLLAGLMFLGFAHLVETIMFVTFNVGTQANEIIHRLLIGFGFVLVIQGFLIMRRAFEN